MTHLSLIYGQDEPKPVYTNSLSIHSLSYKWANYLQCTHVKSISFCKKTSINYIFTILSLPFLLITLQAVSKKPFMECFQCLLSWDWFQWFTRCPIWKHNTVMLCKVQYTHSKHSLYYCTLHWKHRLNQMNQKSYKFLCSSCRTKSRKVQKWKRIL